MNLERELKRFVRQIRPGLIGATVNPNTNLNEVIEEIKASPHLRDQIRTNLETFLVSRDFVTALTETGLTLESGVFSEIYKRLEYKLLPKPVESADILTFLTRVFDAQADAAWLEKINRERFSELMSLLLPDRAKLIDALAPQFFMSLEILSLRLAGLGYDPVLTHRLKTRAEYQHAFMDVTRHVHALLDGKGEAEIPTIRGALTRCSSAVGWVRSRRAVDGVSLAMTYRLIKIQQVVRRMELLLELMESILGEWKPEPARELFFEIMLAEIRRFNLGEFLEKNLELLAFQITEHTGKTGEHYITKSRSEWAAMFKSAAIGGAIVGLLAVIKILIARLHLPLMLESLAFSLDYSIGFLLIHILGGTLATKQPAMTASTLASALDGASSSEQTMEKLSDVIIRTIRSQLAALMGNYLIAFPVAAFICLPFNMFNLPIMTHEKAWTVIESLHPVKSLSFFYAAVAGIGLFMSGLIAGFADNWFIFNHVGARLKNSDLLKKLVGAHNLDRAIHTIDHNLGFWVGNVSLGFYLGTMYAIGNVTGLPLDVRHITFSSGQFGAAMATLKFQAPGSLIATVMFGILIMGLINLAVSFSLTLFVVIKSRKIRFSQTPQLLTALGRRFRHNPIEFVFPTQDAG